MQLNGYHPLESDGPGVSIVEWILISAAALPFGVAPVFYFLVFTFYFFSALVESAHELLTNFSIPHSTPDSDRRLYPGQQELSCRSHSVCCSDVIA
jgi:hypothetical protein